MGWIYLAQNRNKWRIFYKTIVMTLRFINVPEILFKSWELTNFLRSTVLLMFSQSVMQSRICLILWNLIFCAVTNQVSIGPAIIMLSISTYNYLGPILIMFFYLHIILPVALSPWSSSTEYSLHFLISNLSLMASTHFVQDRSRFRGNQSSSANLSFE
jgi:hypothetical protein